MYSIDCEASDSSSRKLLNASKVPVPIFLTTFLRFSPAAPEAAGSNPHDMDSVTMSGRWWASSKMTACGNPMYGYFSMPICATLTTYAELVMMTCDSPYARSRVLRTHLDFEVFAERCLQISYPSLVCNPSESKPAPSPDASRASRRAISSRTISLVSSVHPIECRSIGERERMRL